MLINLSEERSEQHFLAINNLGGELFLLRKQKDNLQEGSEVSGRNELFYGTFLPLNRVYTVLHGLNLARSILVPRSS
jgi:hypothetical protein